MTYAARGEFYDIDHTRVAPGQTCWERFSDQFNQIQGMSVLPQQLWGKWVGVVFLHERTSPNGHRRLVAVYFDDPGFAMTASAITPGGLTVNPIVVSYQFPGTNDLSYFAYKYRIDHAQPPNSRTSGPLGFRIYLGQADDADPAHFTIPWQLYGRAGTIDGWLQDNDKVRLQCRYGEAQKEWEGIAY